MNADVLVDDYLRRLEAEAARIPSGQRTDLVDEIREHIDMALAEAGARDEATVRTILDRLGSPSSIVDAAGPVGGDPRTAGARPQPWGWGALEVIAALLMTVGMLALPLFGPLVGLVLAWASSYWSTRAKLALTIVVLGLIIVPVVGLLPAGTGAELSSGTSSPVPLPEASG